MKFIWWALCLLTVAILAPTHPVLAQGQGIVACDAGDGAACLAMGEELYLGQNTPADVDGALALFRKGCALDHAPACMRLGLELEFPDTGQPDVEGAQSAYTAACRLGMETACAEGAFSNQWAYGPPADDVRSDPVLLLPEPAFRQSSAALQDVPVLTSNPAAILEDSARPENLTGFASEALPDLVSAGSEPLVDSPGAPIVPDELADLRLYWAEGCAADDIEACENLAGMLQSGEGGPADPARARRIYSVICTQGSVIGCYELAWLFYEDGGELAMGRARFLFSETCAAGMLEACLQAGDMRRSGEGGPLDLAGAARSYAMACEAGLGPGCMMATDMTPAEETVASTADAATSPESDLPTE